MAAAGAAFRSGAGKTPFADVPAGAWYEDAAAFVYEAGLMQGTSGTAFSPDRITTRGQIAAILHRLEGEPGAGAAPFSDVTPESYCAAAAAWAAEEGIVLGYGDGTFRPDVPITRQQLATILFRYMGHRGADTSGRADLTDFRDSGNAAAYAREPLSWAVSAGLLQGRSGGILGPLRLRHPGPDGGAAPAAGRTAGRELRQAGAICPGLSPLTDRRVPGKIAEET